MSRMQVARGWLYPIAVWQILLAMVFVVEYAVMLLLPSLVSPHSSRILESAMDSILLTIVVAPMLWWTIVRPLREVIRLRTQFLTDLFAQIESDRRKTAYELHDGVGQVLTLLISGLRSATSCRANTECSGRVDEFQRLAENALAEVRRVSMGLRPSLLDDLGLVPALERLVEDVRCHHNVDISLETDTVSDIGLAEPVATAVFRIVQEALTNVIKHSQARKAGVVIRKANESILIEVTDDGIGIEPASLRASPQGHLGVRGMSERATLLGGEFSLDSAPGKGTCITVKIPARETDNG